LREIRKHIECELLAPVAAKNTVAAIKAEMQSLTHMPARIHLTPEQPWHDQGVRRDRVNNYYTESQKDLESDANTDRSLI
jgi:hypothetical protein